VKARAERDKVAIDAAAIRMLVERAGIDIIRLRGGLERVALYAMGQSRITVEDIKQVVPATAEATNFGIADAIKENDAARALRELAARAGRRGTAVLPHGPACGGWRRRCQDRGSKLRSSGISYRRGAQIHRRRSEGFARTSRRRALSDAVAYCYVGSPHVPRARW